ncbi:hypothetical protein GDO86_004065 [Hymenochirus boettgeri]|uniref:Lysosome-associated membrane glycoprotein 1 n=1 Tax=Hymenochirus boettgeri TaxID=247094 RepID=A0A8T2K3R3_9PIPI|nr:hypothetical protein GDO86_004065 [Hymenochirus boettgeri]KAG8452126.1 hypothetical protein GDO86_004065 [Hymenochirus boettgeri]
MLDMETDQRKRVCPGIALLVLIGLFRTASSVHFEVKDSKTNKTCILADLSVNFSVAYKTAAKQELSAFMLPMDATVDLKNSSCDIENTTGPLLAITFGANHSLSINFTRTTSHYQVAELVMVYNLSDKTLFKDASENGTKQVSTNNTAIFAEANSTYRCFNPHLIKMEGVNATFHDVKLEAYLNQNNFSQNESKCTEDFSPTTLPTSAPTTAPVTPNPPPVVQYTVNGTSGPCLLARVGLQFNISYSKKDGKDGIYVFNIESNGVTVSGNCTNTTAFLVLSSGLMQTRFNFLLNSSLDSFYLAGVYLNTSLPSEAKVQFFDEGNGTLRYLQTNTHKSYKCNSKQALQITSNFSVNTYNLQVQAFNVDGDKFGPAIECSTDENGMLVPIVVGAALAGLVLIVLIAYLIGRKRSHAGYQTI